MLIENVFRIGRAQYAAGASLGPRKTIGFEFVRILKGQVSWIYDGHEYSVQPGDWILSQPDHQEHYIWDINNETVHDHIHFTLALVPKDWPNREQWPLVLNMDQSQIMHALFEQIIQLHKSRHKQAVVLMKQAVQHMLHLWIHDGYAVQSGSYENFSKSVQRVVNAMQMQWNQGKIKPLPMQQMVKIACVSRSSFLRAFQRECQDTPSRFFERQRLHLGRLHLLKSNRTIEQIADLLQYSSAFHFSKNFKQCFNCSPRDIKFTIQPEQIKHDDYAFTRVFNLLSATQVL